jgi:hypothetical protein
MVPDMRSGAAAALAFVFCACSGVTDLSRPQRPLATNEQDLTRTKVDEALRAKQWKNAWNLEAAAGTNQGRLEQIALATLEDDDGDAEEMLEQIRKKFGGYSEGLKAGIRELTQKAVDAKDYKRAVDIQLASADDAPKYEGAWDVFQRTPAKDALSILERINGARQDYEEKQAKAKGQ